MVRDNRNRDIRVIKEETSFGDDVLHGLNDFIEAVERGDTITVRALKVEVDPREYSPGEIQALRKTLGVNQGLFATLMAVNVKTVQAWERGLRRPPGTARRLLDEINDDPGRWIRKVKKWASEKPSAS